MLRWNFIERTLSFFKPTGVKMNDAQLQSRTGQRRASRALLFQQFIRRNGLVKIRPVENRERHPRVVQRHISIQCRFVSLGKLHIKLCRFVPMLETMMAVGHEKNQLTQRRLRVAEDRLQRSQRGFPLLLRMLQLTRVKLRRIGQSVFRVGLGKRFEAVDRLNQVIIFSCKITLKKTERLIKSSVRLLGVISIFDRERMKILGRAHIILKLIQANHAQTKQGA